MPKYYLRMEGVNLANFVYDTQDLSTIRGGGLLLLDAVTQIQTAFPYLKPISTGASSGLFHFEIFGTDDGEGGKKVKKDVIDYLHKKGLEHATFVVEIQKYDNEDNFVPEKELLIAKNRWEQMQTPTVAVPRQCLGNDKVACWIDGVRPAIEKIEIPDPDDPEKKKEEYISSSVNVRRKYGKDQKKELYKKIYEEVKNAKLGFEFVNDLDALTNDNIKDKGNLHHKMAVIYLDGNGFGKIRDSLCAKAEDEKEFDTQIKKHRREMLATLLDNMRSDNNWKNNNEYRIETLLWGGDELMWVVPAWKGWEALQFFYEQSKTWEFVNSKGEKAPLTHAGGMVFCHHNAPIYRIKDLVKKLSDAAKNKAKEIHKTNPPNLFAYQVLESFDHISHDFDKSRERQAIGGNADTLILNGDAMENIRKNIQALKDGEFPKNKLHEITKKLRNNGDAKDLVEKAIKGLSDATKTAIDKLKGDCNGDHPKWGHIADLWDYIALNRAGENYV